MKMIITLERFIYQLRRFNHCSDFSNEALETLFNYLLEEEGKTGEEFEFMPSDIEVSYRFHKTLTNIPIDTEGIPVPSGGYILKEKNKE